LQEQGEITGSSVHGRDRDDESDDSHPDGPDGVPELFLRLVGVPRVDQGDDTRKDPRRRTEQQGLGPVVSEGTGEGGEVGVEGQSGDDGDKTQHEHVESGRPESELKTVSDRLLVPIRVALSGVLVQTELSDIEFFLGEALGIVRHIGQHESGDDGDSHGKGTFDEEQPTPCGMSENAFHVVQDTGGDEGTEGVRDQVLSGVQAMSTGRPTQNRLFVLMTHSAEEDSVSQRNLLLGVPFTQHEQGSGQEDGSGKRRGGFISILPGTLESWETRN
jgi:hypothetical protein